MKEYRNYLFDLYGTLVDVHTDESKELVWERTALFLRTEGGDADPQAIRKLYFSAVEQMEAEAHRERGRWAEIDIAPIFAAIYRQSGIEATRAQVENLAKLFRLFSTEKLRLFPDVLPLLTRLKKAGKRVYLLSNAQALFTLPEWTALNLAPYFDGMLLSSDAGLKKPSEALYHLAMTRFALHAEDTVMVGNDDEADCRGAARLGMDSMYISTAQSPKRTEPLPENCRVLATIGEVF